MADFIEKAKERAHKFIELKHVCSHFRPYDPDPAFMLHWEKGKVNAEDIPKEKGKKPVRRPAAKNPG